MPSTAIMIPARIGSTRFPNKPLAKIAGKPMVLHVIDRCREANLDIPIYVATDSEMICEVVEDYGANYVMTGEHPTGTDRLAEANQKLNFDYVINVRGDEPVFNPTDIRKLTNFLLDNDYEVVTGYSQIIDPKEYVDEKLFKIVFGIKGKVLYLSRAAIPGTKDKKMNLAHRNINIDGYSKSALKEFSRLQPTSNEIIEEHELIRFLDHGISINCISLSNDSIPVNIPSDIQLVENWLEYSR